MKVPDSFKIQTAVKDKVKFPLDCRHTTTMDFMTLQPIYYRHLVPNSTLDVDVRSFMRLASMPCPTFGDAKLKLHAYFVPYRQVCPFFNEFITDSVYVCHLRNSTTDYGFIPAKVPTFYNRALVQAFIEADTGSIALSTAVLDPTTTEPDFVVYNYPNSDADPMYRKFTALGKQAYKILMSLGYKIEWNFSLDKELSALPLLSFLHVYLDWFWPNQYRNLPLYKTLESQLKREVTSGAYWIGSAVIHSILEVIPVVCYSNDYFTAAFDNPSGPNDGNFSTQSISDNTLSTSPNNPVSDITNHPFTSAGGIDDSPAIKGNGFYGVEYLSQYALDSLRAMTNYMRRHQLAGSKALERFLSRFGVKPSSEIEGRSRFIGSAEIPLVVLDQMSTAETSEARIGDYAGKGFIQDDNQHLPHFHFESGDDFGMAIVTASIIPSIDYVEGVDRHNTEISRLDFFNPEYDALGCQAISAAELLMSNAHSSGSVSAYDQVFGFIPRDAHRKVSRSWLTGDYALPSMNQAGDVSSSWHLFRLFDDITYSSPSEIVHSPDFIFGKDRQQYDRIFYNTSNQADHFYGDFFFNVIMYAPMKRVFDFVDFKDDEHSKDVIVDTTQTN